jgi:hypothetical protein
MNKFLNGKTAALSAVLVGASQYASADLAAGITALTTSVSADIASVSTYAYAILGVSLTFWIGMKLVKKASNKAT